jgi:MEDS: MEthanogen/methylotroph, DcmR Sensory domain
MSTSGFRHQGFMDHVSPSRHIPMIAPVIKARLQQKHRCLYFNSKPMVARLRSNLAEIGVDVARETANNSLVFSSHLSHLSEDQTFDIDRMIATLEDTLNQTLQDGYVGLWATGDVAWELGPKGDFGQLLQYEMQLEDFLCAHTEFSGICLYHASVLPPDAMQTGHEMHPSFFISETQSRLNPAYRVRHQVGHTTSPEDILEVSLPNDMFMRASACAHSQGISLDEFINRAITEKLYHANQKKLKN